MADALRVKGYREFLRAASQAEKESKKEVRAALREAAEPVRAEAASLFSTISQRSAAGYRVRVRQRGVSVEQSLRKTTGQHPEFGALQMRRALIPALERKQGEIERRMEHAIDRIADHFER
jgi:hypothetical protein